MTFEQLLEEQESKKIILHTGEVVEGTVFDVKPEEIILDLGCKSDGILSKYEYTNDNSIDLTQAVKPGDKLEVKVLKVDDREGQVIVSYKRVQQEKANQRIEEAFNNQEVLTAKVTAILKGGITVEVDGTRIFIPASLVPTATRRIFPSISDRTSTSLLLSTILTREDASVTASSFLQPRRKKCRRHFLTRSRLAILLTA